MELIPISTAQNNQGDCKLLIIMLLHCKLPSLFNLTGEPNSSLVLYVNVKA